MTPHKATESEWIYVRLWAEDDAVASALLEIADRVAALEEAATPPPPPAADHSRGATEMVATDEELIETFYVGARGALATPGFRAIYDLGRQHGGQPRQENQPTTPPAPAGGLVEELASVLSDGKPLHPVACRHALRLVADWLDTRPIDCCSGITGLRGCAAELRQEVDQGRADG